MGMVRIDHLHSARVPLYLKQRTEQPRRTHIADQMCSTSISKGQVSSHFVIYLRGKEPSFRANNRRFSFGQMADQTDGIASTIHQRAAGQLIFEANVICSRKKKTELRFDMPDFSNLATGN